LREARLVKDFCTAKLVGALLLDRIGYVTRPVSAGAPPQRGPSMVRSLEAPTPGNRKVRERVGEEEVTEGGTQVLEESKNYQWEIPERTSDQVGQYMTGEGEVKTGSFPRSKRKVFQRGDSSKTGMSSVPRRHQVYQRSLVTNREPQHITLIHLRSQRVAKNGPLRGECTPRCGSQVGEQKFGDYIRASKKQSGGKCMASPGTR